MKWIANWEEYYDAEGDKLIHSVTVKDDGFYKEEGIVDPESLVGKKILSVRRHRGELIFETED